MRNIPALRCARQFLRTRASHFGCDAAGTAALEFGLVSVPFLALLFAIFQISLMFLMQQGLRVAVEGAARQVLLGKAQANTTITGWQTFRDTLVCPTTGSILPSFVTCANIVVDVRAYSSFSTLTTTQVNKSFLTDGTGPSYTPGSPCDIVVVRAIYPMPVYLPFLINPTAGLTSYNGSLVQMLTAASVFRNEPYATGTNTNAAGCSS